jgi:Signal transduction histidine kinase, nitrate/nitrite-specific
VNIFRYLRSSFSAQLSLWVTGFVSVIFVVALTLLFRFSLTLVKEESLEQNMQVLEHAALRVDRTLHQTETTAAAAGWMVREHLNSQTTISALCHEVMLANPWIDSCYVVPVDQQSVKTASWQKPLLDSVSDSVALRPMVMTYCLPIFNTHDEHMLTLVIDVQVDWTEIHTAITSQIPYGHCFLQGVGGRYRLESSGYRQLQVEGKNVYHFYRPFSNAAWGMAMLCPERDIMADYNRLQTTGILVMVAVLLLLLLVCRLVIDYNLKPLDLLSVKVRRITQNHFDEPIPTNNRQDEIGELQRGFSTMQQSLASHLTEMHHKTEELQKRNEELQIAYERGLEDERAKTAFLSSISERIMVPVNKIHDATDYLDFHYQDLTKEEMARLQQQIVAQSEIITNLIDQTLKTAL